MNFEYTLVTERDAEGNIKIRKFDRKDGWKRTSDYGVESYYKGITERRASSSTKLRDKDWVIANITKISNANVSGGNVYYVSTKEKQASQPAKPNVVTMAQVGINPNTCCPFYKIGNRIINGVQLVLPHQKRTVNITNALRLTDGTIKFTLPQPFSAYVLNTKDIQKAMIFEDFLLEKLNAENYPFIIDGASQSIIFHWKCLDLSKPVFEVKNDKTKSWWSAQDSRIGYATMKSSKYPLTVTLNIFNSDNVIDNTGSLNMIPWMATLYDKTRNELMTNRDVTYTELSEIIKKRLKQMCDILPTLDKLFEYLKTYNSTKLAKDYNAVLQEYKGKITPFDEEGLRKCIALNILRVVGMDKIFETLEIGCTPITLGM